MAVSGFAIGGEIAKALGLPPETTDIQINIGLDEAVTVVCRFYPSAAGLQQVLETLRRYHLQEADGPPFNEADAQARAYDREVHEGPARRRRLRETLLFREALQPRDPSEEGK